VTDGDYPIDEQVKELVDRWCDRRDLRSLRLILDGWPRVSGLTDEWARLMEALRSLRADRRLPDDEQAIVERLVVQVEQMVYRS
jgi:adenylate kinase family enzyme